MRWYLSRSSELNIKRSRASLCHIEMSFYVEKPQMLSLYVTCIIYLFRFEYDGFRYSSFSFSGIILRSVSVSLNECRHMREISRLRPWDPSVRRCSMRGLMTLTFDLLNSKITFTVTLVSTRNLYIEYEISAAFRS